MKQFLIITISIIISFIGLGQTNKALEISQDMMTSLKMNQSLNDLEVQLEKIPFATLTEELNSDLKKQAFWANIYITYSQKLLAENGTCEKSCRNQKVISVGNRMFSLNDILYKILLHSKNKMTGGKNPISSKWVKQLRVGYPDGRILLAIDSHEAIANAVTYYEPNEMDQQLNEVSTLYLKAFVYYDLDKNEVFIPLWLKRFRREFGQKSGMISGLKKAGVIPKEMTETAIIYSDKIATFK
jgi:hypothetical protein